MWRLRDILVVGLAVSGAAASNWFPGHKTGEYRPAGLILSRLVRMSESDLEADNR
jgi:hypothetical protein